MGRKAVGPVCYVMHVKEPSTLIVKEKRLAPVFHDSRLEHPAGWICACYKSSVILLLSSAKRHFMYVATVDIHVCVYNELKSQMMGAICKLADMLTC